MNNEFSQKVIEYNLSQQKAFNVLFDKNQKIAFQKTFKQMPTILAYPFPDGSLSYPFFVLNPLGYAEHRQKKNILSVQGLTLESDILSKPLQEEWYSNYPRICFCRNFLRKPFYPLPSSLYKAFDLEGVSANFEEIKNSFPFF